MPTSDSSLQVEHISRHYSMGFTRAGAVDDLSLSADKPTGNLDSATGEAILALLQEQSALGMTIFMVTHELSLAAKSADRLAVMGDGKLVSDSLARGPIQ